MRNRMRQNRMVEGQGQRQCRHFWLIESPGGPTSLGVCKLCGAEKKFFNSVPEMMPLRLKGSNAPHTPDEELAEQVQESETSEKACPV